MEGGTSLVETTGSLTQTRVVCLDNGNLPKGDCRAVLALRGIAIGAVVFDAHPIRDLEKH